jgi:hypothetical protein
MLKENKGDEIFKNIKILNDLFNNEKIFANDYSPNVEYKYTIDRS